MTRHVLGRVGLAVVASLGLLLGMVVVPAQQATALEVGNTAFAGGWRPVGGFVYAIARAGDKVILGGQFTSLINAAGTKAQRTNLAAISASTGELLSWAPNPTGAAGATNNVRALAVSDDERTVYVGGTFTSIGSAARTNLAAVSASSGTATAFQVAAPDNGVRALLLDSGTVRGRHVPQDRHHEPWWERRRGSDHRRAEGLEPGHEQRRVCPRPRP